MERKNKKRIFLSHDGAVDDLMALALLAVAPEVDLVGASLVNGDCLAEPALRAQAKLLLLLGRDEVSWSLSRARAFNAFPWEYRGDCVGLLGLPALADVEAAPPRLPFRDGERHLAEALEGSEERGITLIFTGPLTPLQLVLESRPALETKIAQVVWMGGAIDAPGNLDPATLPAAAVNRYAEWNAYWDPFAVDWVFRNTSVPLVLAPLDVSDAAPVTAELIGRLRAANGPLAQLAAQAYAMVTDQPYYRLWDVVAAAAAVDPELFGPPEPMRLAVETRGPNQGWIRRDSSGREAAVLLQLRAERFFDFVVERFSG